MDRFRRRLKSFASIALLAFAGLALAPTISRALLPGEEALPHAAGSHRQMAAMATAPAHHHDGHDHHDGSTPPPAEHRHSLDHCAMCVVAACAVAFDAAPQAFAVQDVGEAHVASPASAVPRWSDDWSPATSRGPPFTA